MADAKIKEQRDRFLAFSFASADLFLEVDGKGEVIYAMGAAKSLTGVDDKKLVGHQWLDIFSANDRNALTRLGRQARPAQRCGPLQVTLDEKLGAGRSAILTAIKMPGSENFHITIGFLTGLMARMAQMALQQENFALHDKEHFLFNAREAFDMARTMGKPVDMTLLEIPDTRDIKRRLGNDWWDGFVKSMTHVLSSNSFDGQTASQIAEGRYSVIHDKTINSDTIRSQIEALAKESDPKGQGFEATSKNVTADLRTLTERETTKALLYTINEFERKGNALNINSLNNSFKAYITVNTNKAQQLKSMIETLSFDMVFQPIVDLETYEAVHFEMLARFRGETSTQEWICFGEDVGMAADIDLAVCERALNYLEYKSQGRRTRFAINLSGQSMQSEQFFKNMMTRISKHKGASERLIFEITESNQIQDLQTVSRFVQLLQAEGYKVCLDDFGAGAASFQYLENLPVDYVKIDGQYTRKILGSERDRIMVKNLVRMCHDLGIAVIAEQIEQPQQATILREMGIKLGQGYLFARPSIKPEYTPPDRPAL